MKRFMAFLVIAMALSCLLLCSCSNGKTSQEKTAELDDLFEGIDAPALAVQLDYDANSGYEWTCDIADDSVLAWSKSYIVGQPSSDKTLQAVYILVPQKEGETEVDFTLVGSWDPDNPAQTCTYTFKVDENLNIKAKSRKECEGANLTILRLSREEIASLDGQAADQSEQSQDAQDDQESPDGQGQSSEGESEQDTSDGAQSSDSDGDGSADGQNS